jgi:eukaryotic-like serine/threonine-protein kinase
VLSPDGQRLAVTATDTQGRQLLWVRSLDAPTAQPLLGTDGAGRPFWSPDSRYLGYFANGKLNRIDASGGPPLALCDAAIGAGGSWGPDGTILFADVSGSRATICRVPASGGTPHTAIKSSESLGGVFPQFLPDGKHFLFPARGSLGLAGGIYFASLDGGEAKLIFQNTSNATYAPPGYLLFVRARTLMAQRFDAGKLQLRGDAMPVAEHVGVDPILSRRALFSVSDNGILVYHGGSGQMAAAELLWFDRNGKPIGKAGSPGAYASVSLSPDGNKLVIVEGPPFVIWIHDLARDVRTRLTFGAGNSSLDFRRRPSPPPISFTSVTAPTRSIDRVSFAAPPRNEIFR